MTSQIDPTVPVFGEPTTASVRAQFLTARNEITELQQRTEGAPFLRKAGDRLEGPLYLAGDPIDAMMPVTRAWAEANFGAAGGGGETALTEAPADDFAYGRRNGTWVRVLRLAGDEMLGPLILARDPEEELEPATKRYADAIRDLIPDEAPDDDDIYGRHQAGWVRVLPITGGELNGGLSVGLVRAADTNLIMAPRIAGTAYLGLNIYGDPARYYAPGGAAILHLPTGSPGMLNIRTAPAGAASGTPAWGPPLTLDQRGCVVVGGTVTLPADVSGSHLYSAHSAVPLGGSVGFNTYVSTSGLRNLATGPGARITLANNGALSLNTFGSAANNAPVAGGTCSLTLQTDNTVQVPHLLASGNATVNGVGTFNGNAAFASQISLGGPLDMSNNPSHPQLWGSNSNLAFWLGTGINAFIINRGVEPVWNWQTSGGTVAWISGGGNMYCAGSLAQGSDARSKMNISDATQGIEIVRAISPKTFARVTTPELTELGFIAQDFQTPFPMAVQAGPATGDDADPDNPPLSLKDVPLIAVLWNTARELDVRIQALEAKA